MNLIQLTSESDYLSILYSSGKNKSIRGTSIKDMLYNSINGDIVLVKDRNTTIALNYIGVEDPDNAGNPFASVDDMWTWLINAISGGPSFPLVIEDGNTVAWYDSQLLSTITKDGSDFVSQWDDKLGSGHDLLQAVGSYQPKWFLDDGVLFDGIDNFMKALAFTYVQPEMIYIVFKQVTWVSAKRIFDGDGGDSGELLQLGATPSINIYAGSHVAATTDLALNTFGIARCLLNGADSFLTINDLTKNTGNAGLSDMGGFTLANIGNETTGESNIQVKEIILRKIADTAGNEQDIYDYLAAKYSI